MILSRTFSPVPETDFAAQQWGTDTTRAVVCNCRGRHDALKTFQSESLVLLLVKFSDEQNSPYPPKWCLLRTFLSGQSLDPLGSRNKHS